MLDCNDDITTRQADLVEAVAHVQAELRTMRINRDLRHPDKIVYLRCDPTDVLLKRIRQRGRSEEAGITPEFLEGLGAYYRTFPQVAAGKYKLDVMTVDVEKLDIRAAEGKAQFLASVDQFLAR